MEIEGDDRGSDTCSSYMAVVSLPCSPWHWTRLSDYFRTFCERSERFMEKEPARAWGFPHIPQSPGVSHGPASLQLSSQFVSFLAKLLLPVSGYVYQNYFVWKSILSVYNYTTACLELNLSPNVTILETQLHT